MESFIEDPSRWRYNLICITTKPFDETFSTHKLDKREQDDSILASIIEFLDLHQMDQVIYITHDVGPRLKSKGLGTTTFKLSEEYLLPDEPDESEKEKLALQKELSVLRNRIPDFKILFETETDLLAVKHRHSKLSEKEFVQKQMDEIKDKYSPLFYYPPDKENRNALLPNICERPTNKEIPVLFRDKNNSVFYDLTNPLRTDLLIDNWFQKLLSRSTESIERYL